MSSLLTLLTDFGLRDPFVGLMKAVIEARLPRARVIDLTHGIPPQDVTAGSYWLERSYRWFPVSTVHIAVVDPGVGSARAAIVLCAAGHYFVAPDNGLLSGVIESTTDAQARRIDPARLGLTVQSSTFHGRDLFAPVGAEIAAGRLAFEDIGPLLADPARRSIAPAAAREGAITGSVVCRDHFGNLITNIDARWLHALPRPVVELEGIKLRLCRTYSDVAEGEALALVNSFDSLEIAVRNGSAADVFRLGPGAAVRVWSDTATP